jgi:hypothetical protein
VPACEFRSYWGMRMRMVLCPVLGAAAFRPTP